MKNIKASININFNTSSIDAKQFSKITRDIKNKLNGLAKVNGEYVEYSQNHVKRNDDYISFF
jgi:hypothetical protein